MKQFVVVVNLPETRNEPEQAEEIISCSESCSLRDLKGSNSVVAAPVTIQDGSFETAFLVFFEAKEADTDPNSWEGIYDSRFQARAKSPIKHCLKQVIGESELTKGSGERLIRTYLRHQALQEEFVYKVLNDDEGNAIAFTLKKMPSRRRRTYRRRQTG